MNGWLLTAGILLVLVTMVDVIQTTLATSGGGHLTELLIRRLWKLALLIHRRTGQRGASVLRAAGPLISVIVPAIWILFLWGGWLLVFLAAPGSVVDSQTRAPADLSNLIYFSGYTIFTLGVGNFIPADGVWEVLTAVASANGFSLITLSATYLVPLVSASTEKNRLAGQLFTLGDTPQQILLNAWDGNTFDGLKAPLEQLVSQLELHTQRHLAYPMLHYYYSGRRRTAVALGIATLFDAIGLLDSAVSPEVRLPPTTTEPIRRTIRAMLEVLDRLHIRVEAEPPPLPSLDELADANIPLASPIGRAGFFEEETETRQLLHGYVRETGWVWNDVEGRS